MFLPNWLILPVTYQPFETEWSKGHTSEVVLHLYPVGRVNYINYLPTHVALRIMAVTEVCKYRSRSPGHSACLKSTGAIYKQGLTIKATAAKRRTLPLRVMTVTEGVQI